MARSPKMNEMEPHKISGTYIVYMPCRGGVLLSRTTLGERGRIPQNRTEIRRFQVWISRKYTVPGFPCRQQSQKAVHGKPQPSYTGFPVHNRWVDCHPVEHHTGSPKFPPRPPQLIRESCVRHCVLKALGNS